MSNNVQKPGYVCEEEKQLMAEERWITEVLGKLKTQRNSLQIERLHLESLKLKIQDNTSIKIRDLNKSHNEETATRETPNSTAPMSVVDLMRASVMNSNIEEEIVCNNQELNLAIGDTLSDEYVEKMTSAYNTEEEDDHEDQDDLPIDMNMLMNGFMSK